MNITHHDSHATLLYFLLSLVIDKEDNDITQVSYRRVIDPITAEEDWVLCIP